jgi:hypothetical protein
MLIRASNNTTTFRRAFVLGGSGELAPEDTVSVTTDELHASLEREQADRRAVERGENEGMVVHPDKKLPCRDRLGTIVS